MTTTDAVALIVGGGVIVSAVVGFIIASNIRSRREELPRACRPAANERRRSVLWIHAAPSLPFTTAQARRALQLHRACVTAECPRKLDALEALAPARPLQRTAGAR
jgi:hypothetical protein